MIKFEDHCVGCPLEMGCFPATCPYKNVEIHICDKCGEEIPDDEIYTVDDLELCEDCLKNIFRKR